MGAIPTTDPLDRFAAAARVRRLQTEQDAALRQRMQRQLFTDIADTAIAHDVRHPGGFLAEVMAGFDPRARYSKIALILDTVRSRGPGAMPDPAEWDELADMIEASPVIRGEPVPLELSTRAAEKILPFVYAKPSEIKAIEDTAAPAVASPLTPAEIETFQEYWNDEY